MAVREWLWMQEPDFNRDGIFKLVPKEAKWTNVLGDSDEKEWYLNE
jgi:hypothetical protein